MIMAEPAAVADFRAKLLSQKAEAQAERAKHRQAVDQLTARLLGIDGALAACDHLADQVADVITDPSPPVEAEEDWAVRVQAGRFDGSLEALIEAAVRDGDTAGAGILADRLDMVNSRNGVEHTT